MLDFLRTFVSFLIFAPLSAAFFGFLIWLVPAIAFREQVARLRLRPFAFFVTGYLFIGLMGLYLVGWQSDHDAAPLLGTIASLALVWAVRRWWRARRASSGGSRVVARFSRTHGPQAGMDGSPRAAGSWPGYQPGQPGPPGHPGQVGPWGGPPGTWPGQAVPGGPAAAGGWPGWPGQPPAGYPVPGQDAAGGSVPGGPPGPPGRPVGRVPGYPLAAPPPDPRPSTPPAANPPPRRGTDGGPAADIDPEIPDIPDIPDFPDFPDFPDLDDGKDGKDGR